MTLDPSFDLSRWTRFHHTCLILSSRSFSKVRSGGDAEAKADEIGSFLCERGPRTSHILAQEKKLRTFSLLCLVWGNFCWCCSLIFFFFHLDSHEVRNGESCWAGQAGRQLLGPPPLWSHRRILTLQVVQPPHPPSPGQLQTQTRRSRPLASSVPRPLPPAPLRGEGGGCERGGTCEPSPNCRVHTLLPGSRGGPQGAPLLDSSSPFNIQVGMPPCEAVWGAHLKFQV